MIDIIITSYNEPKSTLRAVNIFLNQKTDQKFRVIVVDPFPEVENFLRKNINDKRFDFFLDPGEGKGYALNLLFKKYDSKNRNDFFILTDGDVYTSDNSIEEILKVFQDSEIGCVTGRPISIDNKDSRFGFWAKILFAGIDKTRKKLATKKKFFECSGYLFAIRKGVISDFPLGTSEDSIIPYLFWKEGYKIGYAPRAEVYVKNPSSLNDWTNQKIRNIKAHENLDNIAPDMPRTKSLYNEIKEGALFAIKQPKNFKQLFWTLELYFFRMYIYLKAFQELKKKSRYMDGWREKETPTTRTLD